ncbi:hypothetical protein QMZ05_12535 [Bradyrhizobium sp. INPA03-11B]|uniref:hypothetical protein n=1 Tax=Bradyrhizobium sp. INPA03-11B TaxID=418598 RepID=UPI003390266D
MDRLDVLVANAHRRLRLRRLLVAIERNPSILEEISMTPNVKGLGSALAKLKHDLDLQAGSALTELSQLGERANAAMTRAKQKIAETRASVEEIEAFVAEQEGSNGGPSLETSSSSSAAPGAQPAAAPEHLSVNGVSQG